MIALSRAACTRVSICRAVPRMSSPFRLDFHLQPDDERGPQKGHLPRQKSFDTQNRRAMAAVSSGDGCCNKGANAWASGNLRATALPGCDPSYSRFRSASRSSPASRKMPLRVPRFGSVKRDHQRGTALRVLKPYMTSALAHLHPSGALRRLDELRARCDRCAFAHAGTASRRRTTPVGSGSPSSCRPST